MMIYILVLFFIPQIVLSANAWYKYFEGKIGEHKVTFHLTRYEASLMGYYYYDKYRQPIQIGGSVKDDSLVVYSYISMNEETFSGKYINGIFSGSYVMMKNNYINPKDESRKVTLKFELKENKVRSAYYNFKYIYSTEKLFADSEESPAATYLEGFIFPTSSNPRYQTISEFILKEKNFNVTGDPENQLLNNSRIFFDNYFNDHRDIPAEEVREYPFAYNREESDILTIVYEDNNIFIYGRYSYAYYGGAHGNYTTQYGVLDSEIGRRLTYADVLDKKGQSRLPSLLEKYFRKKYGLKDHQPLTDAGLFEDKIKVNDNFFLTPGCIAFCYSPYEIGPYALGEILLYIPLYEIENNLTVEARKLLIN